MAKEAAAHAVRFYAREAGRVFLHPSSVNFGVGRFESGWLVYSEAVQTAKVYIRESSMVPAYALLLFGGDIEARPKIPNLLAFIPLANNIPDCNNPLFL